MRTFALMAAMTLLVVSFGCSKAAPVGSSLALDMVVGGKAMRLIDNAPSIQLFNGALTVKSKSGTEDGNNVQLIIVQAGAVAPGDFVVSPTGSVVVSFSMPGVATQFPFEMGTATLTSAQWFAGGAVSGQLKNLFSHANSFGLAPETTASGTFALIIQSAQ